jgi:hypothetical protein
LLLCWQYLTFPLRVNVNLKAVTVEDLIARRKVEQPQFNHLNIEMIDLG